MKFKRQKRPGKRSDFSKYNGQWLEHQWKMICEEDEDKETILSPVNYQTFRSIFFQAAHAMYQRSIRQILNREGSGREIFDEMFEFRTGVSPAKHPIRDECDKFIKQTLGSSPDCPCPPLLKDISVRVYMTGAFAFFATLLQAPLDPSMAHATVDQQLGGMDERLRTLESELDAFFSGSLPGVQ